MMAAMNGRPSKLVLAGVAGFAALALAGCSGEVSIGGDTINSSDLETQLADQLAPQGGLKPSQISVACPDGQKAEKGAKFDCTLTTPNGDEVTVNVTLTDDNGDFNAVVPKQ